MTQQCLGPFYYFSLWKRLYHIYTCLLTLGEFSNKAGYIRLKIPANTDSRGTMDTIPEPCTDITILPYNPDGLPVDLASITTQNVAIEYPSAYATFTTDVDPSCHLAFQVRYTTHDGRASRYFYTTKTLSPLFRPDTLWIFLMAIPRMKK